MFPKAHAVAYVLSAIRVACGNYIIQENIMQYIFPQDVIFDIETLVAGKDAILSRRKKLKC